MGMTPPPPPPLHQVVGLGNFLEVTGAAGAADFLLYLGSGPAFGRKLG